MEDQCGQVSQAANVFQFFNPDLAKNTSALYLHTIVLKVWIYTISLFSYIQYFLEYFQQNNPKDGIKLLKQNIHIHSTRLSEKIVDMSPVKLCNSLLISFGLEGRKGVGGYS